MDGGAARRAAGPELRLRHEVRFAFEVPLAEAEGRALVRDPQRSLRHAGFLNALRVDPGDPPRVTAELPVNAGPFGVDALPFASDLIVTEDGARLEPRVVDGRGLGWAEVEGEARVTQADGDPSRSRLEHRFEITVHLATPTAERWGAQALMKMIELTAANVLKRVAAEFPLALEAAALEASRDGLAGQADGVLSPRC